MDNIGPYLSYAELICELFYGNSPAVATVEAAIVLSNKTVDVGGDIYDVDKSTAQVGDVITKIGACDEVIEVFTGPDRIRISKTGVANTIANGTAKLLRSESVPKFRGEDMILDAMEFIDEITGQFFNLRPAIVTLEGNNTPTMWLPVPIITIRDLKINGTDTSLIEGEDQDFVAFKGRQRPQDDRRNPRIKLSIGSGRSNIFSGSFSTGVFAQHTLTRIDGDFGFLEADGSTPRNIKNAAVLIVADRMNKPFATQSSSTSAGGGPVKRIRVDLHEKEFFENKQASSKASVSSGIPKVDQILAKYKAPILIGGSIQILGNDRSVAQGENTF